MGAFANGKNEAGKATFASGVDSIATGTKAAATNTNSISIGTGNIVNGANSSAFGDPSIVDGTGSYEMGNDNAIGAGSDSTFVLGNINSIGATATRDADNVIDTTAPLAVTAKVTNSVILGSKNNLTTTTDYDNVLILGNGVSTVASNSIFLGDSSGYVAKNDTTTKGLDNIYTSDTVSGTKYDYAGGDKVVGVVSVGKDGQTRRIQNVAPGLVSATSTDAINGSQLFATNQAIDVNKIHYFSVNGPDNKTNYDNKGAQGNYSLVAGIDTQTNMGTTTVLGSQSKAINTGSIGYGSSTLLGYNNTLQDATKIVILGDTNKVHGNPTSHNANKSMVMGSGNTVNSATAGALNYFKSNTLIGVDNTASNMTSSIIMENLNTATGSGTEKYGSFFSSVELTKLNSSILLGNANTMSDTRAVSVIGGDNTATNSYSSSVTGINNTLTNVDSSSIMGINNTINMDNTPEMKSGFLMYPTVPANKVQNNIIGVSNTIQGTSKQNTILGSSNTLSGDSTQNFVAGFGNTLGMNLKGNQILGSSSTIADNVTDGVLIGRGATLSANKAVVIGQGSKATSESNIAIGSSAESSGSKSTAVGNSAKATKANSTAFGNSAQAKGENPTAFGYETQATSKNSTAFGYQAKAINGWSTAFGYKAEASGTNSPLAIGTQTISSGSSSIAMGDWTTAKGEHAVAIGAQASGGNQPGQGTFASGKNSIAIGTKAQAGNSTANSVAENGIAIGTLAKVTQNNSVTIGLEAEATTVAESVALGSGSVVDRTTANQDSVYMPITASTADKNAIKDTIKGSLGAVSVGSSTGTRHITNVAAGKEDSDAVNVAQLKSTVNTGLNFNANTGNKQKATLGSIVSVKGDDANSDWSKFDSGKNIMTKITNVDGNNTINIALAKNLTGLEGATFSDPNNPNSFVAISGKDGISTSGVIKVVNDKNQTVAQLDNTPLTVTDKDGNPTTSINKALNALDDGVVKYDRKTDSNDSTKTIVDKENITLAGGTDAQGNTTPTAIKNLVSGLVNTNGYEVTDPSQAVSTNAVNAGDLSKVSSNIVNNIGFNIQTNGGTAERVGNNDTINFKDGKNISITNSGKDITVALKDDITLNSIKTGNTVVNDSGITISNSDPSKTVSLTNKGLNNGGNQITNVESGLVGVDGTEVALKDATGDMLKNVANIGDLQKVDNSVQSIAGDIDNITNTIGGPNNKYVDANGNLTDDGRRALTTNAADGRDVIKNDSVIQAINNINEQGIRFFHVNSNTEPVGNVAKSDPEDSSAGSFGSIAVGMKAEVGTNAQNAIAIGTGAQALAQNAISIGTGNIVSGENSGAIGDPNIITGSGSYVLGNDNKVDVNNAFVVGTMLSSEQE